MPRVDARHSLRTTGRLQFVETISTSSGTAAPTYVALKLTVGPLIVFNIVGFFNMTAIRMMHASIAAVNGNVVANEQVAQPHGTDFKRHLILGYDNCVD